MFRCFVVSLFRVLVTPLATCGVAGVPLGAREKSYRREELVLSSSADFKMANEVATAAAALYKDRAIVQRREGLEFIKEISPKPGDTILDLGCGTGELTVYLAELVGPTGKVIGVDPDCARIKLAQESYQHIENLSFVEGCGDKFPDMELGKYDLIFSNYVLHWISNKEQVLNIAFRSVRPNGKIAFQFARRISSQFEKVVMNLFPDASERILKLFTFEGAGIVKEYFLRAGFSITKCHKYTSRESFSSMLDMCKWIQGVLHGVIDAQSISKECIQKFNPSFMEDGELVRELPMARIIATKNL